MVYYTNRRDRNFLLFGSGARGNGVWNATLSERRSMSSIFLEHSRLPQVRRPLNRRVLRRVLLRHVL